MVHLTEAFRVLGDPTRLRLLRLIAETRLNVSELVSVVGVGQSSVSHHLSKLKSLGLVEDERQAGFTFHSLAVDDSHPLWSLIKLAQDAEDTAGDKPRLRELLRRREDAHALNEKLLEPGQSWRLWLSAVSTLLPALDVADFGCGSGVLSVEIATWARHVTAIDRSSHALVSAKARASEAGLRNITFLEADLHALPLEVAAKDLVVISQSLHFVDAYEDVLAEAARILKPQGRLMLMELLPHEELWVKSQHGHVHQGFEPKALEAVVKRVGFKQTRVASESRDSSSPFKAFFLTGVREARASRASTTAQTTTPSPA